MNFWLNGFFWLIILVSCFMFYFAIAKQTGFKVFTDSSGKSRFGVPNWIMCCFAEGRATKAFLGWWENLDKPESPGKQFVVFTFALLVGYVEFRIHEAVWVGLLIILIAAVAAPPKGKLVRWFMYVDFLLLILAAFFPAAKEMRGLSYDITAEVFQRGANGMKGSLADLKAGKPLFGESVPTPTPPAVRTVTANTGGSKSYGTVREYYVTPVLCSSLSDECKATVETMPIPTQGRFDVPTCGRAIAFIRHDNDKGGTFYACNNIELAGMPNPHIGFVTLHSNAPEVYIKISHQ